MSEAIKEILANRKKPRVYLAGPTVFEEDPASIFEEMKRICLKHGIEGVSPLDNQIGLEGIAPGKGLTLKIVKADLNLMDTLDGGIFCLDPFRRSTEMDPGTAIEIGYMKAQKKPIAGWTRDGREYPQKVRDFFAKTGEVLTKTKANDQGGTSGLTRDPDGILVHSDGMVQNGMTQGSIELSGGKIGIDADWKIAFEQAVISIKEQFIQKWRMDDLKRLLPKAWTASTSNDGANWSRQNPAWGQCAVTACLVADELGGDLVRVEYPMPDGKMGSHYFNILPNGERVDLTAVQFAEGTSFIPPLNSSDDDLIAATRKYVESKKFDGSTKEYVLSFPVTQTRYETLRKTVSELENGKSR